MLAVETHAPARTLHLGAAEASSTSAWEPHAPSPRVLLPALDADPSADELVHRTQQRLHRRYTDLQRQRRHERRLHGAKKSRATRHDREEQRHSDQKAWLQRRGLVRSFSVNRAQQRMLRGWFDSIDADGSGVIDVSELEEALVSTGVCTDAEQVQRIFSSVDHDGSGEIGFAEFLEVLLPRDQHDQGRAAPTSAGAARALAVLQRRVDAAHRVGIGVDVVVSQQRRRLLMHAITADTDRDAREDEAIWQLSAEASQAARVKNARAASLLEALQQRRAARDRSRIRKRNYVGTIASVVSRGVKRQQEQAQQQQAQLVDDGTNAKDGRDGGETQGDNTAGGVRLPAIAPHATQAAAAAKERKAALRRIRARKKNKIKNRDQAEYRGQTRAGNS